MGAMIFAIDPGTEESAWALLDKDCKPVTFGKVPNDELLKIINLSPTCNRKFAIEMVASYGMAVGKEVFETVYWIGRYWEAARPFYHEHNMSRIYRIDVKNHLCHSSRANDSNIRQALIDRFGVTGTKKNPGWFYGVSGDIWSAIAVGVVAADRAQEAIDAQG
jgi:hypothetical protein